ncbi:MAG: serine/threonine protein kinase, partial [Polyangiaceae bacterium]|nr:serine/threonine protein kinase [Polyangiaceae bacterium]
MNSASKILTQPKVVANYRLEKRIGAGAMGDVYEATHLRLGKRVALKLLMAGQGDPELRERFLQEGIAASRIRHPNVVEVMDAGQDGEHDYLVMALLEGESLADHLKRTGRLNLTAAVDLIIPLCAALHCAHRVGVVHRDIKPGNIFLADVGRWQPEPMLLDFGISKLVGSQDHSLTQNPRFIGTPFYIAPEQAEGAPGSALSDQYSLALTLYELILGIRPFEEESDSLLRLLRAITEKPIPYARHYDQSLPEDLEEVLSVGLAKAPNNRFDDLQDFGAALLPFASLTIQRIWEGAFVSADRTLNSINSPISAGPAVSGHRRVQVRVEAQTPIPGELEQ